MKIKSKFFLICNLICVGFIFATENPAQIIELQTIIAEIKEPQIEQKQILTQEEIQQKNPTDLIELLETMGIQIKGYGSYGSASAPSIRGFTGSTIKVVIDGICVNSAQNGTFDFSSLNVENISKIEWFPIDEINLSKLHAPLPTKYAILKAKEYFCKAKGKIVSEQKSER